MIMVYVDPKIITDLQTQNKALKEFVYDLLKVYEKHMELINKVDYEESQI